MTVNEGKALLEEILVKCKITSDINSIICYKYGSKKSASDYQSDIIKADLTQSDFKAKQIKYVIKYFKHTGVFVGWSVELGRGNGRYIVYKKDLEDMERSDCCFKEIMVEGRGKVYLFREREGVIKFVNENLANYKNL